MRSAVIGLCTRTHSILVERRIALGHLFPQLFTPAPPNEVWSNAAPILDQQGSQSTAPFRSVDRLVICQQRSAPRGKCRKRHLREANEPTLITMAERNENKGSTPSGAQGNPGPGNAGLGKQDEQGRRNAGGSDGAGQLGDRKGEGTGGASQERAEKERIDKTDDIDRTRATQDKNAMSQEADAEG